MQSYKFVNESSPKISAEILTQEKDELYLKGTLQVVS